MLKLSAYTAKGIKKQSIGMPKNWQEKVNKAFLVQVIRVYEARCHPGLSKVKTRGEVISSTRKIYRQKGTGRARHGALSAPIFTGGGRAHGPKGVKRKLTLSRKMRRKALSIALTVKAKEGHLIVVSALSSLKKTKEAVNLISNIVNKEKNVNDKSRFIFAFAEKNSNVVLALRNIKNVQAVPFRNLNAYNVFLGGILVVDGDVIKKSAKRNAISKVRKNSKI
jgi:large subunit ribosomal protein L4